MTKARVSFRSMMTILPRLLLCHKRLFYHVRSSTIDPHGPLTVVPVGCDLIISWHLNTPRRLETFWNVTLSVTVRFSRELWRHIILYIWKAPCRWCNCEWRHPAVSSAYNIMYKRFRISMCAGDNSQQRLRLTLFERCTMMTFSQLTRNISRYWWTVGWHTSRKSIQTNTYRRFSENHDQSRSQQSAFPWPSTVGRKAVCRWWKSVICTYMGRLSEMSIPAIVKSVVWFEFKT